MTDVTAPPDDALQEYGPSVPTPIVQPINLTKMAPTQEFFYAQLNDEDVVSAVSQLAFQVDAPNMIRVESLDAVTCWQRYDRVNGVFLAAESNPQPAEAPTNISVGAFFDRFGAAKYSILSSANPMVQALVKDASVRIKDGVNLRSPALLGGLKMLQQAGFAIDAAAIVDAPIQPSERP